MERLAVIAGLIIAAGFVIGSFAPGMHVSWDFSDEMHSEEVRPAPPEAIFAVPDTVYEATGIRLDGAAAAITIVPEDRTDLVFSVQNEGPLATPQARVDGGVLVLSGEAGARASCRGEDAVRLPGVGTVRREDLPQVTVRTPRAVTFGGEGFAFLNVGPSQSAEVSIQSCSQARIEDVAGPLTLSLDGAGSAQVGRVEAAVIRTAGAGDVAIAAVTGSSLISIEGNGDVDVESAQGAATVEIAGSGAVRLGDAQLAALNVKIEGSGEVDVDGDVSGLAQVSIAGSGEVDISGGVQDLEARIEGSGDVDVGAVTRSARQEVHGSGSVSVGSRTVQTRTIEIGDGSPASATVTIERRSDAPDAAAKAEAQTAPESGR